MGNELAVTKTEAIERALIEGDLSKLTPQERIQHYLNVCQSLGLNPHTKPFGYIVLNGKTVLYALREATEQLRKIQGVSITSLVGQVMDGLYIVTATARDREGRIDSATGAVSIDKLVGEAKANAIMKAETKAKRRATLSICGLGMLDEHEADSIPNARTVDVEVAHVALNLGQGEAAKTPDLDAATVELKKHEAAIKAADTVEKLKAAWGAIPAAYHKALVTTLNDKNKSLTEASNAKA